MTGVTIDGETRITGLIGDPVAHSRSPAILNTAYREAGLNWIYAAFPVPRGRGGDAVRGALALRFAGLTVTMPHKADAAGACDELTPDAIALGAINVVTVTDDGRLLGSSSDGEGFLRSVRDEGFDPAGHRRARRRSGWCRRAPSSSRSGVRGRGSPSLPADSTPPNRLPRWCPEGRRSRWVTSIPVSTRSS